ncbi:MAG: hypothetical protein IK151_04890 [Erysipelotrichaceae bacterium]|nr:hypothetical protein [Erysipelotrichaceae bacterium]
MKKLLVLLLGIMMVLSLTACKKQSEPEPQPEPEPVDDVISYSEYAALPTDGSATVVINAYVQAVQSYWDGGATFYLQDKDGAYLAYAAKVDEADYAKLVSSTDYSAGWTGLANGMKVRVEGTKSEWSGEVEIVDGVVTLIDDGDKWLSEAYDITAALPTDPAEFMNRRVKMSDMTVVAANDEGAAFLYSWDGSGEPGSDLYFNVEKDDMTYTFVVESYLCYDGSEAYEAVEALQVGQTVDLEGFLYWYEGPQPHIVSVTVK